MTKAKANEHEGSYSVRQLSSLYFFVVCEVRKPKCIPIFGIVIRIPHMCSQKRKFTKFKHNCNMLAIEATISFCTIFLRLNHCALIAWITYTQHVEAVSFSAYVLIAQQTFMVPEFNVICGKHKKAVGKMNKKENKFLEWEKKLLLMAVSIKAVLHVEKFKSLCYVNKNTHKIKWKWLKSSYLCSFVQFAKWWKTTFCPIFIDFRYFTAKFRILMLPKTIHNSKNTDPFNRNIHIIYIKSIVMAWNWSMKIPN